MAIPDDIINTVRDEFGLGTEPAEDSWENRIQEAAFTPPSGVRITFDYEDLSYRFNKKTSAFQFPDADGTLVQDHGVTGRRFPMRVFFWGADYDRQAQVFEAALSERGVGVFESPVYGTHDVVVFGEVIRRDDLVSRANQAVFEITFFKTIGVAYPTGQDDPANAALSALDLFGDAQDAKFASAISVVSVAEEQGIIDTFNNNIDKVSSTLSSVAAVQQSVADEFQDLTDTVQNTIDVLIGQPLELAGDTRRLIQAPATALASISARLDAYGGLAEDIFTASDAVSEPGGPGNKGPEIDSRTGVGNDSQEPNKFHSRDLFAANYVAGSVLSVLYTDSSRGGATSVNAVNRRKSDAIQTGVTGGGNQFETATQALEAAETLLAQWGAFVVWRDENFKNINGGNLTEAEQRDFISAPSNTDSGDMYIRLANTVALAAGFLVDLSFSLKREKSIVLDRDRSIVDLTYEIYGTIDESLDFLINSNNLTMTNLLEVPKGRKIVYYV